MSREWISAGFTDWPHFLRIDCDYAADGLWDEGGAAFDLEDFPFGPDLIQEVTEWQRAFDATDPADEQSYAASQAHIARGQAIARHVKSILPRCVVVGIDRRVGSDGSLAERVPWPGEWIEGFSIDGGVPFRRWKEAFLKRTWPD